MRASPAPEPSGGPTLWWVWGDLKQALGRLEQGQVDMRREFQFQLRRVDQRLDARTERRTPLRWAMRLPWDRILGFVAGGLGVMGYLKPEWVRLLTGH